MNILMVHNFYQQGGGEDEVFLAETQLLRRHGLQVFTLSAHNDDLRGEAALKTAFHTIWNSESARTIARLVREKQIDVVHFHNTFPIISPAAYSAARASGAAVVQTLHNYRFLCAAHTFYRDGQVCEACLGKTPPWPAIQHACYRGSRAASGVVVAMQTAHRLLRTYQRQVDLYIALSETARRKYVQGGLPAEKLVVKPNFLLDDPGEGPHQDHYALFVGRLTPEKGVRTLLEAWQTVGQALPLKIVGTGPLSAEVEELARTRPGLEVLGQQPRAQVLALMRGARLLVFPSEWYEGFPMTLVEALACGLPVVASRIGSVADIIDQRTGRHFQPGQASDLAAQVLNLLAESGGLARLGQAARQSYLSHYTAEHNIGLLLDIYRRARRRPERVAEPA